MKRDIFLTVSVAGILTSALLLGRGQAERASITLAVTPPGNVRIGSTTPWRVIVTNAGSRDATLVFPGDGSDAGFRSPVVSWRVERIQGDVRIALVQPKSDCATINPMTGSEIFTMRAGESRELEGCVGVPQFDAVGKYSVSYRYENVPEKKWTSSDKETEAMRRMRGTNPASAESPEVIVEVLPAASATAGDSSGSLTAPEKSLDAAGKR